MTSNHLIPSLSTACLLPLGLNKTLDLASEAGFSGIELVLGGETWLLGAQHLARLASARALAIHSVHQALFRYDPSGWAGGRMLAAARTAVEIACPRVVIHGPWTEDWSSPEGNRWLTELERCQELLAGSETQLSLENPGVYSEGDRRNVLASFSTLFDFAARNDLALTLDTCHVGTDSPTLLEAYRVLSPRLTNIHLSDLQDARFADRHLLRSIYAHHQFPGEGRLDLKELLAKLELTGYQGPVTLEASPFALRALSSESVTERLSLALAYIQNGLDTAAPV